MVAHGLWDMSVFLPASDNGIVTNLLVQVAAVTVAAVIAVIVMFRKDRSFAVTERGLRTL